MCVSLRQQGSVPSTAGIELHYTFQVCFRSSSHHGSTSRPAPLYRALNYPQALSHTGPRSSQRSHGQPGPAAPQPPAASAWCSPDTTELTEMTEITARLQEPSPSRAGRRAGRCPPVPAPHLSAAPASCARGFSLRGRRAPPSPRSTPPCPVPGLTLRARPLGVPGCPGGPGTRRPRPGPCRGAVHGVRERRGRAGPR